MKVNLRELIDHHMRSWISVFVYQLMSEHTENADDWKQVFGMNDQTEVEICVTVGGVEVPFDSFIKMLEEQHDKLLAEKAKELIAGSFGSLIQTLSEMEENAKLKLESDVLPSWEKNR